MAPRTLRLPFHFQILRDLVPVPPSPDALPPPSDDESDDAQSEGPIDRDPSGLLILARGLGLRRIVCALLKIYDDPRNLILLLNARSDEEDGIGDLMGTMGVRRPGLRVVTFEMGAKQREDLYRQGGLISVTSRILVVDMLSKTIPTNLITGLVVLHAEQVTPTSLEAFIVRIYRQENQEGFLKAFSDQPESFTAGLLPLQTVMRQLSLRKVWLWPRFHEKIQKDLVQRKADVVELYQSLTPAMREIQTCIVECMEATLNEVRRANGANIEVDDFTVENALFRSFDRVVRHQLDPVWHRVGPKTKQLVGDLAVLRRLLGYLLTYDSVTFHSFLETILASNSTTASGNARQNQSPWLFMDAANTIFSVAKRRAYTTGNAVPDDDQAEEDEAAREAEEDEAWALMYEIEGVQPAAARAAPRRSGRRRGWLPPGVEPVLEELPKWGLLADVLEEIENMIHFQPPREDAPGSQTVLVMCESDRTVSQLREYLSSRADSSPSSSSTESPGRPMMERLLREHFFWKGGLGTLSRNLKAASSSSSSSSRPQQQMQQSAALKRKDEYRRGQQPSNKRRRVRGGSVAAAVTPARKKGGARDDEDVGREATALEEEAGGIADFIAATQRAGWPAPPSGPLSPNGELGSTSTSADGGLGPPAAPLPIFTHDFSEMDFDTSFGLLAPEQTVVIRPYRGEDDDQVLAELRPRYIVMYDPDPAFVRRIEIYRSSNPGLGVRVYFMMYGDSVEEQRYLSGLRKEKDAFERLIREKGTMLLPLLGNSVDTRGDDQLLTALSARIAGGQRQGNKAPPRVIVDIREFRSSLPGLLHKANMEILPATLTVGDYILDPTMCVERKSIPDLIQSFNSGRLYTQCEIMSTHYKTPILLIEFEENKSFSLETIADAKTGGPKTGAPATPSPNAPDTDIQAKLVLLTLAFPRLRILWSSSPHITADMFADLKLNRDEPDLARAVSVGAGDGAEEVWNTAPGEVLRALPGVTGKSVGWVTGKVGSVRELVDMSEEEVREIVGVEPGKKLYGFIHRDVNKRPDAAENGGGAAAGTSVGGSGA